MRKKKNIFNKIIGKIVAWLAHVQRVMGLSPVTSNPFYEKMAFYRASKLRKRA